MQLLRVGLVARRLALLAGRPGIAHGYSSLSTPSNKAPTTAQNLLQNPREYQYSLILLSPPFNNQSKTASSAASPNILPTPNQQAALTRTLVQIKTLLDQPLPTATTPTVNYPQIQSLFFASSSSSSNAAAPYLQSPEFYYPFMTLLMSRSSSIYASIKSTASTTTTTTATTAFTTTAAQQHLHYELMSCHVLITQLLTCMAKYRHVRFVNPSQKIKALTAWLQSPTATYAANLVAVAAASRETVPGGVGGSGYSSSGLMLGTSLSPSLSSSSSSSAVAWTDQVTGELVLTRLTSSDLTSTTQSPFPPSTLFPLDSMTSAPSLSSHSLNAKNMWLLYLAYQQFHTGAALLHSVQSQVSPSASSITSTATTTSDTTTTSTTVADSHYHTFSSDNVPRCYKISTTPGYQCGMVMFSSLSDIINTFAGEYNKSKHHHQEEELMHSPVTSTSSTTTTPSSSSDGDNAHAVVAWLNYTDEIVNNLIGITGTPMPYIPSRQQKQQQKVNIIGASGGESDFTARVGAADIQMGDVVFGDIQGALDGMGRLALDAWWKSSTAVAAPIAQQTAEVEAAATLLESITSYSMCNYMIRPPQHQRLSNNNNNNSNNNNSKFTHVHTIDLLSSPLLLGSVKGRRFLFTEYLPSVAGMRLSYMMNATSWLDEIAKCLMELHKQQATSSSGSMLESSETLNLYAATFAQTLQRGFLLRPHGVDYGKFSWLFWRAGPSEEIVDLFETVFPETGGISLMNSFSNSSSTSSSSSLLLPSVIPDGAGVDINNGGRVVALAQHHPHVQEYKDLVKRLRHYSDSKVRNLSGAEVVYRKLAALALPHSTATATATSSSSSSSTTSADTSIPSLVRVPIDYRTMASYAALLFNRRPRDSHTHDVFWNIPNISAPNNKILSTSLMYAALVRDFDMAKHFWRDWVEARGEATTTDTDHQGPSSSFDTDSSTSSSMSSYFAPVVPNQYILSALMRASLEADNHVAFLYMAKRLLPIAMKEMSSDTSIVLKNIPFIDTLDSNTHRQLYLRRRQHPDGVVAALRELEKSIPSYDLSLNIYSSDNIKVRAVFINTLLRGLFKTGRTGLAVRLVNRLQRQGLPLNLQTLSIVTNGLAQAGRLHQIISLLANERRLNQRDFVVSNVVINPLIAAFAKHLMRQRRSLNDRGLSVSNVGSSSDPSSKSATNKTDYNNAKLAMDAFMKEQVSLASIVHTMLGRLELDSSNVSRGIGSDFYTLTSAMNVLRCASDIAGVVAVYEYMKQESVVLTRRGRVDVFNNQPWRRAKTRYAGVSKEEAEQLERAELAAAEKKKNSKTLISNSINNNDLSVASIEEQGMMGRHREEEREEEEDAFDQQEEDHVMLGYYKREKFVSNTEIEVPVLTVLANACSALDAYARRPAFVRVDVVPGSVHDTFGDVLDDGIMTIGKSTRLVPLPLPPVSTRTGFDASNSFQHHKNPASNSEMAEYVVQEFLLRILNYNMVVDRIAWEDLFHGLIRLKMEAYGVHLIHDLVGVWLTKIEQQFKLPASSSSDSKMGALQLLQHVQHCIDSLDLNGLSQVLVGSRASAQTTYTLKERGEEKGGKDVTFNSLQVIDEMAKRMIKLDQYLKHGQEQSSTTSNSGAETVLPYKLQQHLGNTITPQYSGIEDRGLKMDLLLVLKNARSDLVS